MRSRGPPSASSTVSRDAPKPVSASSARERGRPVAVGGQRQDARARLQMRAHEIERAAVQRDERRLRQRPAEPRRGQAEGRRRRHAPRISCGRDVARQHRADAVVERIAGGEHADLPAAMRQHLLDGALERARPWPRRAADQRRRERRDGACRRTRSRRRAMSPRAAGLKPVDAVLADADDGQPAARCGSLGASGSASDMRRILILGGTAEARQLAERLAGARRPCRDAVARRPHRGARRAAGAGAHRRLRRRRGLADYLSSERIDALIDATHPYAAAHLRQCGARPRERPACRCWRCARPPWSAVAGDRWTEVADVPAAVRALGAAPRRVFLALGRKELAPFAGAPQHHYLVRSVDPVEPPLAVPHAIYVTGRGPFGEADERALLERAPHRGRGREEQRRHRDLRQDRGGARARPRR